MNKLLTNVKKYQFMFEELVKRDFKQKYKRSVLGMAWSVLSPLLTLLVMHVIFSNFFGKDIPHYTTYLFTGNIVLSYYKESTKNGMQSLMSNAKIFTKINVPKYLFLLSKNVSALVNFGLTLLVYFTFCIFDGITFRPTMFLLIFPILCLLIMDIGIGAILSALFVFFRDIQYLYEVFLTLITYMSAVFYSVDKLPHNLQQLLYLNPVYVYIKYMRLIVIDGIIPSPAYHALCIFYALFYLGIGMRIYKKCNHSFLYYL
ncbi:MAG: ABC transporter permease [Lachnospiraceae bacterium]|nr:ABC transporter permease [Bacillota bacterium]MDY2949077.1 ABC transporter permease [Lachnospiraceae bacterium]CCX65143.1 aBC-type polysaccharide/polyol phosphate export systems permease component [Firmicutes bacterium CAG:791]MCI6595441.1 ABC transporter permease [Bacillota bacterium]MDD7253334.1 ABC transporter permease [Bacillota bacterium]